MRCIVCLQTNAKGKNKDAVVIIDGHSMCVDHATNWQIFRDHFQNLPPTLAGFRRWLK